MALVWLTTTTSTAGEWGIHPLAGECCLAGSAEQVLFIAPPASGPGPADVHLVPPDAAGVSPSWTLLGGREAALCVNGQSLVLGIRALRDRDEISIAGHRCFFSVEELARIVAFPGLAQPVCCPRCKQKVEVSQLAVACPHCRAWHHQLDTLPCWTYAPTCALCQIQVTALDAGYSWTPELL